jgi:transcriptional regulator with XRE-family HTH domain
MTALAFGPESTSVMPPTQSWLPPAAFDLQQLLGRLLGSEGTTASYTLPPVMPTGTTASPDGLAAAPVTPRVAKNGTAEAILELRRLSGLGWEQLAELLGVTRRAVHFWASGRAINAVNAERIQRALGAIRFADRGTASDNRTLLLTPQGDGALLRDLLREQAYDRFMEIAGRGSGRPTPSLARLSHAEQARRRPTPPALLLDALQEPLPTAHRPASASRRLRLARPTLG